MMKNKRKEALIQYLATQNDWCPAANLANYFKVSTRTIRKYVSEINQDQNIITSSSLGYRLMSKDISPIKHDNNTTPMDRIKIILKDILIQSEGLDIFDLADRFYLSVSSIENDIVHANKMSNPYQLKIHRMKDKLILKGEEKNKRRLMSYIISLETSNDFLSLKTVQNSFPDYDVSRLKDKIIHIFEDYNLFVNDYIINNIILHLVISVDRIKNNNLVIQNTDLTKLKGTSEKKAAYKIADFLEIEYNIRFNESELYNLILLLSSKTTLLNYQSLTPSSLKLYVDEHYVNLTGKLINKVHEYYLIDLSDDEFFVKFTLHIRNLIFRAKNNQMSKNPLTNKIKYSYPLIYELAVFISNQIQSIEDIYIEEDEISFIAFHVGSYFERKKNRDKKILTVVVCPNYYDMQVQLIQSIETKFDDSIEIIQILSDTSEITLSEEEEADLFISTIPLKEENVPSVFVHPYLTEEDIEHIQGQINRLNNVN